MGLWILVFCLLELTCAQDPARVPTDGGKKTGNSIESGMTRSAKDKVLVKKAMDEARKNGGTSEQVKQAGRQKKAELQKKSDREIQNILKGDIGQRATELEAFQEKQKRVDKYNDLRAKKHFFEKENKGQGLRDEEDEELKKLESEFEPSQKELDDREKEKNSWRSKMNGLMTSAREKLDKKAAQYKKEDPDGKNREFVDNQNAANKEGMSAAAEKAVNAANEMQSKMTKKRDQFGQVIEETASQYREDTQNLLTSLQTPMDGMAIQVEPGQGIVDGEFIELAGWELDMQEDNDGCEGECGSAGDPSNDEVSASDDMLDLLVKECYRGVAAGNKEQVDKNCLTADILTYKCESPIDASFYIGVTFDMTKQYTPEGFRGKLVKHWCREMNTYKGQFDIPDGMHIQGVYDTEVTTNVHQNEREWLENKAAKATSLSGDSVFGELQDSKTSSSANTESVTAGGSVSGLPGGAEASGSGRNNDDAGGTDNSASFGTSKKNNKIGTLNRSINETKTTDTTMVVDMTITVTRYEMFLREVAPNWIHEDFLDCFMMLPNSFYAPKAPEKFQDFITRYGTHYVHAAKFGGTLSIVKKKRILDSMTIKDIRAEGQEEIDSIVGNAVNKHLASKNSSGAAGGGSIGAGGSSIGGGGGSATNTERETINSTNNGDIIVNETVNASSTIDRDRFRRSSTSTSVTAIGGSHKIATTITDLYSTNFRTNLMHWLDSVPLYPKPFEPQLLPITDLMKHLIDDMIDPTCYEACIMNKEDNCLKERKHKISCDTVFAEQSEQCKPFCVNATSSQPECELDSPRIIDCYEIVEQKARMKRKVEALRTATTLYLNEGSLYPPSHYDIGAGAPTCTTSYRIVNAIDEFDFAFGESEEENWNEIATSIIQVQLNMKQAYFNQNVGRINPNANLYIVFDQTDRRWYTLNSIGDPRVPEFSSPPVPFSQLKTIETNTLGVFALIPTTSLDGDEEFAMFRLKQGLWLEINLKNGEIMFTKRCLVAMKQSSCVIVKSFLETYSVILDVMAGGPGQSIGFINPIVERPGITPFPCNARWTDAQMFDGTNDLQQCIKITVSTIQEYFFIVAASIEDKSTWIYVHQTQNSLCLHKLDRRTLSKDEIGVCARKYKKMASGTIPNMVEQLFFCVYTNNDLLSISLSRPSFNRQDREAAITILNHNIIQDSSSTGQLIMPRYFAVGSGQSPVFVKSLFITEIESLECREPFIKKAYGGSFKCTLECSEECSDYGCKQPNDATKCYTCKNSKLILSRPNKDDVVMCVPSCTGVNTRYEIGNEVLETQIRRDAREELKDRPNQIVCVNCHHECAGNCQGVSEFDCESTAGKLCKHYEHTNQVNSLGQTATQCVGSCPSGTYISEETVAGVLIESCTTCNSACASCDTETTGEVCDKSDPPVCSNYQKCFSCAENHLEVVIDVTYVLCIDNTNNDAECPAGFKRNAYQCTKSWRPIGYQNLAVGALTATCRSDSCDMDVHGNFLSFGDKDDFEKYQDIHDYYSFQLAWKVDACTIVILEWKQKHNPLDTAPADSDLEVFGFRQLKCLVTDPNLANLKKISFANANFFIGCPEYQTTKYSTDNMRFTGLTLNTATTATTIFKGSSVDLYAFGHLVVPEGVDVQAFEIGDSTFFSSEMQLSVHDEREPPIGWSAWDPKQGSTLAAGQCERDCNTGEQHVERKRYCRCVAHGETSEINDDPDTGDPTSFNEKCQPCIGHRTQTDTCELQSCNSDTITAAQTGETIDIYHHGCCDSSTAIRVMGLNQDGNELGLNGVYELYYQDHEIHKHKYRLLGDSNIVIEKDQSTHHWKITKNDSPTAEYVSGFISVDGSGVVSRQSAPCPLDAGKWHESPDNVNQIEAHISISCSTGRNTCPSSHPYSFKYGKKCCASPFYHLGSAGSASRLLTPEDDTDYHDGTAPTTAEGCLGEWVACPHLPDRCRTNLYNPGNFKATRSHLYSYDYRLCTDHCNIVALKSDPEN